MGEKIIYYIQLTWVLITSKKLNYIIKYYIVYCHYFIKKTKKIVMPIFFILFNITDHIKSENKKLYQLLLRLSFKIISKCNIYYISSRLEFYLTHYHNIHIIAKHQILKFINKIITSIIDINILRFIITINITNTIITTNRQTY